MLKIHTLKPRVKNPKLIKLIDGSHVTRDQISDCLGISPSWFTQLLKRRKLDKHDSDIVKKVVKVLSKRGDNNE